MKLIDVSTMKQLEAAADAGGYSYEKMMIQVGTSLARLVHERYQAVTKRRVLGLVGGGNNGGDTLVALMELNKAGWNVCAVLVQKDLRSQPFVQKLVESGGRVYDVDSLERELKETDLVLDGLIGTGYKPPLKEHFVGVLNVVQKNLTGKTVVAVECPSGVDCTTGESSSNVLKAHLTVCMEAVKEGLIKFPAFEYCGELVTVDLGIPARVLGKFDAGDRVIDQELVRACLPTREHDTHKGSFGRLLVCGGSVNYPGAPMLAARSAYRSGAGLVECALPERIYETAAANNPENIYTLLEDEDGVISENAAGTLLKRLTNASTLLLGPGFGLEETSARFIQRVLFSPTVKNKSSAIGFLPTGESPQTVSASMDIPLLIDADGLRLLAKVENWFSKLKNEVVLTPHPGEMSALTGLPVSEIQSERMGVAKEYARKWKVTLVLKGALTVVAAPDGKAAVLPYASSVLAKAGTGDVLAGLIAGLLAQGARARDAALAGVWLHAEAARLVEKDHANARSLLPGDLVSAIPRAFASLEK